MIQTLQNQIKKIVMIKNGKIRWSPRKEILKHFCMQELQNKDKSAKHKDNPGQDQVQKVQQQGVQGRKEKIRNKNGWFSDNICDNIPYSALNIYFCQKKRDAHAENPLSPALFLNVQDKSRPEIHG